MAFKESSFLFIKVDAILDDVIESLAGESEKNDSPKEDDFFTHSDAIYSSNNNAKLLEVSCYTTCYSKFSTLS